MENENNKRFLFEISWETCNKVGGIYTVLRTKAKRALQEFGENYILIGPWLENNSHFLESTSPFLEKVNAALSEKGIKCRIGSWDIGYGDPADQPTVILVDYKDRYKIDNLLYNLWSDYGVDSLVSNFEYYEPILFATAAAEVVETIGREVLDADVRVFAQCHEWLAGAAILYLKKHYADVVTVFTAHATVLGRALAGNNKLIYDLSSNFNPDLEAKKLGVFAKHSLEHAAAKTADCFSTVSGITADEANLILGKYPDKIMPNGLDIDRIQHLQVVSRGEDKRRKLLDIAGKVVGKELAPNTILWITSGRYEFHNKGYDLLLTSLNELEKQLPSDSPEIVVLFCVAVRRRTKEDSLIDVNPSDPGDQRDALGIAVFENHNPRLDPIITHANSLGFNNPERKIHIVYSDAYLNGNDGVFNMPYEEVLTNCDLSLFLSFYEPWGYTPPESISYGTPTITTDLAGFGHWVNNVPENCCHAVYVLERKHKNQSEVIKNLNDYLLGVVSYDHDMQEEVRGKSGLVAKLFDWKIFYSEYLDAYDQAQEFNDIYYARFVPEDGRYLTIIQEPESVEPRFRLLQYEAVLPEALQGLRDIAYNFWWSWHESVKILFKTVDPALWDKVNHNPVHFLNAISKTVLQAKIDDQAFMQEYQKKLDFFNFYIKEQNIPDFCDKEVVNFEHPIAYFCMEYGLDECLPIYSGGLGILAGDYLKTMSDLNVPLIAVGLFYKDGYFFQSVNSQGDQIAFYKPQNINQIPMHKLTDESGKEILISVDLLNRTVFIKVWEAQVGRVKLYLLDTDVAANSETDRTITDRLYDGLREDRLMQEIILGIGGTRLIEEKLQITPSIYHLNEGHSAFLLMERVKNYHQRGLSFEEACEAVRSSSIFTTHTPVPAGNEVFANSLIRKYFAKMQDFLGVPVDVLIKMVQDVGQHASVFSMTVLALQFTVGANAVSKMHGKIARKMWDGLWNGFLEHEVPIGEVTNGIHLSTWVGNSMKSLFDEFLGYDWKVTQRDCAVWENVRKIPDERLWLTHQLQQEKLLDAVRERILEEYAQRGESKQLINDSVEALNKDALVIGLSRRFATYKRSTLILRDLPRLTKILIDSKKPVILLVAGKAHPLDSAGKHLVRTYIETMRRSELSGHIIFLENYDMTLAKLLVQGVDVWLNMPLLTHEACGTSGMKAGLNGALNFSVRDGWWDEAYKDDEPHVGWPIESFTNLSDMEKRNDIENLNLMDTLEYSIVPLYYETPQVGFSRGWVELMKNAIYKIACNFNSQRMAKEYFDKYYNEVARYSNSLEKDNYAKLRELVAWRHDIRERFNTVKLKTILINGVKDGKISSQGTASVKVLLFSGKLRAQELRVELLLIKSAENGEEASEPGIIQLELADKRESGILNYKVEFSLDDTGFYNYGIRVLPYNQGLLREQDIGVVYWG